MARAAVFFMGVLTMVNMLCASDAWVTSGNDPEYPNALYFTGVGLSERGADVAKNNSMIEIKKQLSVSVNATILDEQMSLSRAGIEVESKNRVEARARLSTQGDVQGIEIVKTAQKGKIYYAFAVLDKKNFETNTRMKIKELKQDLEKQVQAAGQDIASAVPQNALKKLSEAKKLIQALLQQRTLLSAAAPITEAEKLNYTSADLAVLYEKCVGSIRTEKISGDKQEVVSGGVPAEPFLVKVTSNMTPVSMFPLILRDSNKKIRLTKYTDDFGAADFVLGDEAENDVGTHTYSVEIGLPVSSASVIAGQKQTFTYKVASNPCYADVAIEVEPALNVYMDMLLAKVKTRLAKNDILYDPQACYTLKVAVSAKETGYVQGISETHTILKTDVTLVFTLLDKDARQTLTFQNASKGIGSDLGKSVSNGIEIVKITSDISSVNDKICKASTATPEQKQKIAVFAFKNNGSIADWYDISQRITDMIITRLINTLVYDVVERTRLETLMEEKKLAMSGVVEQSEALELAQFTGADVVLVGSAAIHGGIIDVDARIVDVKTGVAKRAVSVSGFSLSNVRGLADALVDKMDEGEKKIGVKRSCK